MDHKHHQHHDHHVAADNSTNNATADLTTMVVQAVTDALTSTSTMAPMHHEHDHHDHGMTTGMDMDMDMGHGVHDMPGMHGMKMFFHLGYNETILFQEWCVHSAGGMVGAVIGVILLALLYEGLKFLREQLYRQQYTRMSYSTCAVTTNSVHQPGGPAELHKITQTRILSWPHLLQTCLHMTQVFLSYILMLIFMTFNVWLCLGVLIGSGAGYFLFGWRKSTVVDISDHCH